MSSANPHSRAEVLLLIVFIVFLLFYGLGAFGLVGADEPRYAQVAREMLDRGDWITPTLNGKPWLEKPPLYYWQAMLSYRVARALSPSPDRATVNSDSQSNEPLPANSGVTEQTARFPGAVDAALMIAAIFFFLRRFRPGTEIDGALIAASSAGVIGFAHAAATDMPLTACFSIALLAWYAWYESGSRTVLAAFYLFLAFGTLAKGPVAPLLTAIVIVLFAAAKREWIVIPRTLWLPGIALFLLAALPWYVAVQLRNPEFFRVFILEHNLSRFSTGVYHHSQPFWFYIPVLLLAVAPWIVFLISAIVERVRNRSLSKQTLANAENSWPLFLLIWIIVPVLFFSASQSKLPGYILPSVPAAALLVADYLASQRDQKRKIPWPLALGHSTLCGLLVFAALSAASLVATHHLAPVSANYIAIALSLVVACGILVPLLTSAGPRLVRSATMIAVIVSVAAVIRFAAPAIDATQSSRSVAAAIRSFEPEPVPIALFHVNRIEQYGLDFYLNRPTQKYEDGQIPGEAHILVAASNTESAFRPLLDGRKVSYLTSVPAQKLDVFWVGK